MSEVPADLTYSGDHLWARPGASASASRILVGVTDFAQQSLGNVVSVSLPQPGDPETLGQQFASLLDARAYRDLAGA